jgi:hypothetical protein
MLSKILIGLGLALIVIGVTFMIPGTDLAAMDCGCGGAAVCQTKQSALAAGIIANLFGLSLAASGTFLRLRRATT